MKPYLFEIKNLTKLFPVRKTFLQRSQEFVHAVDDVSFNIRKGEILGFAGETGCGKTTCGKLILRILKPTSGSVYFDGKDVTKLTKEKIKAFRKKCHMIYQDPFGCLDPRFTVERSVAEPIVAHGIENSKDVRECVMEVLELVDLTPPENFMERYPHELSGGERQRVSIARALILRPDFIVADEPVSMLDTSIRAGILNLMLDLREKYDLTYLFITHNLALSRYMTDRMIIMYLGKVMEVCPTEEFITNPQHPYAKVLISAVPIPNPTIDRRRVKIKGEVETPVNPPPGCRFYRRCQHAKNICKQISPDLTKINGEHYIACHQFE